MTYQVPQDRNHIVDLLPAYINGTLEGVSNEHIENHLRYCERCQLELNSWKAVRDATNLAVQTPPLPSVSVLDNVWARIDVLAQEEQTHSSSAGHIAQHLWLVFKGQMPLLHKSIWIASALIMAFCCLLVLFTRGDTATTNLLLAFFTSVAGAAGVAFAYGPQNDSGFEITLSTPTSIRFVMMSRMTLVIGYDTILATLASVVIVMAQGGNVGQLIHLWLGPLLLLSSLSLVLSLLLGSIVALVSTLVVAIAQALQIQGDKATIAFAYTVWLQTSPMVLFLAALFIVFAVFYAPRQTRLA